MVFCHRYNTWNDFRCDGINAANVMKVTDAIKEMKLDAYGYQYVNIGASLLYACVV
jgi:hypothetical protein